MVVSTTISRVEYSGNASTTVFAYTFRIFADGDLKVYIVDSAGAATLKTITTHYTVSGAGDASGGNVTMVSAPASGETLVIERSVAYTQSTDYVESDSFSANTHETALDRNAMLTQQNQRDIARSMRLAKGTADTVSVELPAPVASHFIKWNSDADALETAIGTADQVAVTDFMATVLDDTTAAAAATTLGLGTGNSPEFTTVTASTSIIPDAVGGADIGSTSAEWGDVYIADDKALKLGNDQNFTIEYDEDGTDTTRIVAAAGVSLAPHGTSSGNTTELRFMELAAGGNNSVGLKAPDACSDSVYTLPAAYPASSKLLQSTDAGVLTWEDGGGAPAAATSAKTAAYTVVAGDAGSTILCSAASADYAVALTAAGTLGAGFTVTLKKSDATKFMITINPNSTETIDGLLDLKLRNEHSEATLICDGSNWHLVSHENVAMEGNCLENSAMQVDQYSHITRTGLGGGNQRLIDRFGEQTAGAPSARYTMSVESSGGVSGKDKWFKALITTADASPGATEGAQILQNTIGNNGVQLMGTDGLWENGVLSVDIIAHADGASGISFPAKAALGVWTFDGTDRQYIEDVTIAADGVWQRVSIVIPEDSVANIVPGTTHQWVGFQLSIYAGSSRDTASGAWVNANSYSGSNTSENWTDATNNYIGFTNAKLQPGQIATPYIPRLYAEELDICKYYAEKLSYDTNSYQLVAVGGFSANNAIQASITYEEKRATPAITSSAAGTFQLNSYAVGGNDATSVAYNEPGKTNFRFGAEYGGTGYTQDNAGQIRRDAGDDTYIFINADI